MSHRCHCRSVSSSQTSFSRETSEPLFFHSLPAEGTSQLIAGVRFSPSAQEATSTNGIQTLSVTPPGQRAGQEHSRVQSCPHGTWWGEGEHWYLPKEGLGHQLGLSHAQIVGLGKDWRCEGSYRSDFCSFWSDPVGEMSRKLTKCHRSISKYYFSTISVPSIMRGAVRRDTRRRRCDSCPQGATSHGHSQTLTSGKNLGG